MNTDEHTAIGPLQYGRCPACGYLTFPPLAANPCAHDDPAVLAPLEAPAVVYSFTRAWHSDTASTLLVMADLFDGALRVSAPLRGAEEVAIGDGVRLRRSGSSYEFVPA